MTDVKREYGVVGLGRMGGNLARQALEKGMRVVGYTRHAAPPDMIEAGLIEIRSYADFRKHLSTPRAVFVYIPAGPEVDQVLDDIAQELEPGDILVDGGNSYWGDSIRRHQRFQEKGIRFVDLGTSGGVEGARHGACFMAGGDKEAIARIEPMLLELATDGGYVHAGPAGSGHFTKLVHNGIEFGMLQAIGEGMDLLEHFHEELDVAKVLHCWRFGSVIRSWLMDLMEEAYIKEGGLENIPAFIEDTQSVMQLFASRDDKKYWARAIAMMRHGFGGHPYGSNEAVARERREGRVGMLFPAAW